MGVSNNNGTPKSSISIGFSIINHPFWGTYSWKHPCGGHLYLSWPHFEITQVPNSLAMEASLCHTVASKQSIARRIRSPCFPVYLQSSLFVAAFFAFLSLAARMREFLFRATTGRLMEALPIHLPSLQRNTNRAHTHKT